MSSWKDYLRTAVLFGLALGFVVPAAVLILQTPIYLLNHGFDLEPFIQSFLSEDVLKQTLSVLYWLFIAGCWLGIGVERKVGGEAE